jgi:hypothetical protein
MMGISANDLEKIHTHLMAMKKPIAMLEASRG